MADLSMIAETMVTMVSFKPRGSLTLDETSPGPLDLGRDDNTRSGGACPAQTGAGLDGEDGSTRYIWSTCGSNSGNVVVEITVHSLVLQFALGLLRTKTA